MGVNPLFLLYKIQHLLTLLKNSFIYKLIFQYRRRRPMTKNSFVIGVYLVQTSLLNVYDSRI